MIIINGKARFNIIEPDFIEKVKDFESKYPFIESNNKIVHRTSFGDDRARVFDSGTRLEATFDLEKLLLDIDCHKFNNESIILNEDMLRESNLSKYEVELGEYVFKFLKYLINNGVIDRYPLEEEC